MKTLNKTVLVAGLAIIAASSYAFSRMSSMLWMVKSEEVKIMFDLPKGDAKGTVGNLKATIDFDPAHAELAVIKASVDVNSLTTGNGMRDKHLMTADYFDAEHHPEITFTSESVAPSETGFIATGKLAMRDSVKTVTIPFTFTGDDKTGLFKGSLEVFAGDYGVGKKSKSGSDKVTVTIEVPVKRGE